MICWKNASLAVLLMTACGCGGSTGPKLANVAGQVQLAGKPVANAYVQFNPKDGPTSAGYSDDQGFFVLETSAGKGAVAGAHQIKVTVGLPKPTAPDSVNATNSSEQPIALGVASGPPTDYTFMNPVEVQAGKNEVNLNLDEAAKRRG